MDVFSGQPRNVALGTDDQSGRVKQRIQRANPIFLPIFFAITPKGKYRSEIVSGGELSNYYGEQMLQEKNKYTNHVSFFLRGAIRTGGAVEVKRLPYKPTVDEIADNNGATPNGVATVTIWATVSKNTEDVKPILRTPGMPDLRAVKSGVVILTDDNSTDTVKSVYLRLSAKPNKVSQVIGGETHITNIEEDLNVKYLTSGLHGRESYSFPLFTINAPAHGSAYNDYGIWLDAITGYLTDSDMINGKLFPYKLGVYSKEHGAPRRQSSIYGEHELKFTFADNTKHPTFNYNISLRDVLDKFNKPISIDSELRDEWFDTPVVHMASINALLTHLYGIEKTYLNTNRDLNYNGLSDITADAVEDESKLINILTLMTSSEVEYECIRPSNMDVTPHNAELEEITGKVIYAGISNPIYMDDGLDGDISCDYLAEGALEMFEEYTDIDSPVINTATNKESAWVDSGYPLRVKLAAGKLMTHRRDISLIASPYTVQICGDVLPTGGMKALHQSETEALAIETLIKNVYSLYPESVEYHTSTSRAAIVIGYGRDVEDQYPGFIPATYDFMIKNCNLAGAFNGKMDPNGVYTSQGRNIVEHIKDIYPKEITHSLNEQLWRRGAIVMIPNDRKEMIFSSNQTIYPDDTSILNRYTIQLVICALVKLNDEAWRFFTGTDNMLNDQFKIAVEDYINRRIDGKFLDTIVVSPNVYYTPEDLLNGFSWHLEVSISSVVAKTVMISNLKSLRLEN